MSPSKPRKLPPGQEASAADTPAKRLKTLAADPKLTRLVAANPSAPAELLLELSHSDDKAVRKACTSNASTPVEALLKLGAQFPEQLLENPVFDLLLLAHAGLFEELPTATLNSLLKRDQVPVGLIRWAWKHRGESTLHSLLMNPNTPADVVEELCKSKDPEVRMAAELHCARKLPGWARKVQGEQDLKFPLVVDRHLRLDPSPKWYQLFTNLLVHGDSELRERCMAVMPVATKTRVALDAQTLPEVLVLLAKDQADDVRRAVAENPRTPSSVLSELGTDLSLRVRREVAQNPQTPIHTLTNLITDNILDSDLLIRLVLNPDTPDEILSLLTTCQDTEVRRVLADCRRSPVSLLQLASDQSVAVRRRVASNPQTPPEALHHLSRDKYRDIRLIVARRAASIKTLAQLSKDKDYGIRQAVAENISTSGEILAILATDIDGLVRRAVARHGNTFVDTLSNLASDSEKDVRKALAERTEMLAEVLVHLSKDEKPDVRRLVANHSLVTSELLSQLAKDEAWSVRRQVAMNRKTPQSVLQLLALDTDKDVRKEAETTIKMPAFMPMKSAVDQSKEVHFGVAANERVPSDALMQLVSDEDDSVRMRVAIHSKSPAELLALLTKEVEVRRSVAKDSETPAEVLALLAKDIDAGVRQEVAENSQTPGETLALLAMDIDADIRWAVAANRNTLKPIVSALHESFLVQICTDGCKGSEPSPGRRFLFTLPQCPASILAKNFRSRSWLERFAIAGNPSTPESVLERMAKEGNQLVRRAAKANLAARAQDSQDTTSAQNEASQP